MTVIDEDMAELERTDNDPDYWIKRHESGRCYGPGDCRFCDEEIQVYPPPAKGE